MSQFTVTLSQNAPTSPWPENSVLTFNADIATIHVGNLLEDDGLRVIRKAARQLDGMSIEQVALDGDWTFSQQYAFAMSYTRAINPGQIEWAKSEHTPRLKNAVTALEFGRRLVNGSPQDIYPESLAETAVDWLTSLAPDAVSTTLTVGDALKSAGWVGIYEVGRGSDRPPVLLEVDYNPTGDDSAPVDFALVGKGITFDSGGYSIKPSEGMLSMKCDMAGAATVTAALGLAIMQGLNKRVRLFLCCAENLISGHAYKLGDILTYKNGTTVEIVNTDAEGRLVLADGLLAAQQCGAKQVIDAATLTGAAMNALGTDYHAVFSNDDELVSTLFDAANHHNEGFWRLPLAPFHSERCPSPFADTANSRPMKGGGMGGASNAAGFLARFAPQSGWLHLDLAAAYHGTANGEMPAGATGIGIVTLADVLNK